MGRIKESLHAEADADAALSTQNVQPAQNAQPVQSNVDITQTLEAIQVQLAAIAKTVGVPLVASTSPVAPASVAGNSAEPTAAWLDEVDFTLEPGEGIEIKLAMAEGAVATFEWTANGSVLNHDTHGDGEGKSISYEKGRSVPEQAGRLTAAFTGNHGWFWRNRTDSSVVVTLRTKGDYDDILLP